MCVCWGGGAALLAAERWSLSSTVGPGIHRLQEEALGAITGSISYTRFHVIGDLPGDYRERYMSRIQHLAFRPLGVDEEVEERTGWCSVEQPLDVTLQDDKVFFNEYLNLGVRTDRWRIPSSLLKAQLRAQERTIMMITGIRKGKYYLGSKDFSGSGRV